MKKYFAEAIGTMVLVLLGCGSAVFNGGVGTTARVLTVSFAFGLSVVAMAYAIGSISGCHINPAITLGAMLTGRMKTGEGLKYMLAQIIGAFVGSAIILHLSGPVIRMLHCMPLQQGQMPFQMPLRWDQRLLPRLWAHLYLCSWFSVSLTQRKVIPLLQVSLSV